MAPHTRSILNSKLSEVIGSVREFVPSEVPTLRAVISRGLLLQQEKIREDTSRNFYPLHHLCEKLADLLQAQWSKSNTQFVYPVTIAIDSIVKKIRRKWDGLVEAVNGRTKSGVKKQRLEELDKLFDILACK